MPKARRGKGSPGRGWEERGGGSDRSYRSLLRGLPIAVYRTTPAGKILDASVGLARLLGYRTRTSVLGRSAAEFFRYPEVRERWRQLMERQGTVRDFEFELVRRDGSVIWVSDTARTLRGPGGRVLCYEGVLQDVTQRKVADAALRESEQQARHAEALATIQSLVLERVAEGRPLTSVLEELARAIEKRARGVLCSVLLLDDGGTRLRHCVAPSLPEEYNRAVDGLTIGPAAGSCGTAAYRCETVIVTDIATDPLWADWRDIALKHDLRSCWSTPIVSTANKVLGTFAMYYREPRGPTAQELELINTAARVAGIAIERTQVEESRTRLMEILAATPDFVAIAAPDGRLLYANLAARRILGVSADGDISQLTLEQAHPERCNALLRDVAMPAAIRDGSWCGELMLLSSDGRKLPVWEVVIAHKKHGSDVGWFSVIARDLSDQRSLEHQLAQSQKLEALGQLAGGIAHDFNNLLTTILGTSELMAQELPADSPLRDDLQTIRDAARSGAELVGKILAFSRRRRIKFQVLDLGELIGDFLKLARRVVPESVEIELGLDPAGSPIRADRGAVEQILMNLVTNARDAMPEGGRLLIETRRARLDRPFAVWEGWAEPGEYVVLTVQDTGVGMDARTVRRIFEPFFTTKPVDVGTGLGMAVVYGLVKQHGGAIQVESEPAKGTEVRIYFPLAVGVPQPRKEQPVGEVRGGSETILLVEDDPRVRHAAERVLAKHGYRVLLAADGREALEQIRTASGGIDLVVTDVVMPRMSGPSLLRALEAEGKSPRVLMTSGYPATAAVPELGVAYLAKPWTVDELLRAVRAALDA